MIEQEPSQDQTREQIEGLLHEALERHLIVDVVIEHTTGWQATPDLLVDEVSSESVIFAYLNENGEIEGSEECAIDRIKRVNHVGPFQPTKAKD